MLKTAEYYAKAIEHYRLAQTCLSDEARQIHQGIADSFVALANTEAMKVPDHSGAALPANWQLVLMRSNSRAPTRW